MIIECTHCHAKYQYDEAKFDGKTSKKIRCAKCQQVFEITNQPVAAPAARTAADATLTRPPRPRTLSEIASDRAAGGGTREQQLDSAAPITDRAENPKVSGDHRYSLAIIDGPDAGSVFRVERARTIIGRTGADFALNDTESSRNHAVVDIRGGLILLEDLGSTNGTLLEGERIVGPVELQNQSEFQIGSTTLMLIITDAD